MKVSVSSFGRLWGFDLAGQLECRGALSRVYTAYPRGRIEGLPAEKVRSCPWIGVAPLAAGRLGLHGLHDRVNELAIEAFDRWVAQRLEPTEIFHSLSSFGLRSHRVAKERYGALTVCERGSTHVTRQDELLAEEHARWGIPYRRISKRIVERELEEYAVCDLIAVPSSFAYESFIRQGVASEKLVTVPFGVDLSLFRPGPKEDSVFRVIYVGQLSLRKGIPYLLEALCQSGLPPMEIWLIGSALKEVKDVLGQYRGRFRYLGTIPRIRLSWFYSQASVFVIGSVEEGLALVQAQAMACGLPVVATTNTGAESLFTDGIEGFIVPIRNPDAIRERVVYLYEHPGVREEMGRAALCRAQALGGWQVYGTQMVAAYRAAIERRRAKHARSTS